MPNIFDKLVRREISSAEYKRRVESCQIFERQLRDNGYLVVKFFLHISQEEQRQRMHLARRGEELVYRCEK